MIQSSHHVNTNKGGVVKQSGNDVQSYRPQKVLFQPNVRVILEDGVISVVGLEEPGFSPTIKLVAEKSFDVKTLQ